MPQDERENFSKEEIKEKVMELVGMLDGVVDHQMTAEICGRINNEIGEIPVHDEATPTAMKLKYAVMGLAAVAGIMISEEEDTKEHKDCAAILEKVWNLCGPESPFRDILYSCREKYENEDKGNEDKELVKVAFSSNGDVITGDDVDRIHQQGEELSREEIAPGVEMVVKRVPKPKAPDVTGEGGEA